MSRARTSPARSATPRCLGPVLLEGLRELRPRRQARPQRAAVPDRHRLDKSPPPPRRATTAWTRSWRAGTTARAPVWHRRPGCPSTKSAGRTPTRTPVAATPRPPWRRSSRPSWTTWTCSTTPSPATTPPWWTRCPWPSSPPPRWHSVSASAGNSGPDANTVNHSAPWAVTSVAAETFSERTDPHRGVRGRHQGPRRLVHGQGGRPGRRRALDRGRAGRCQGRGRPGSASWAPWTRRPPPARSCCATAASTPREQDPRPCRRPAAWA